MGCCISSLVFKPPRSAEYLGRNTASVTFDKIRTKHGAMIQVCHVHPRGTHYDRTILFAHGNQCEIGGVIRLAEDFTCADIQANLVAFSYTGYPMSEGSPSEQHVYNDAEAVYEYVRDMLRVPNHKLILMAHSLGCAPIIHVAAKYEYNDRGEEHPFLGVVLVSAFTSIYRVRFDLSHTYPGDMFPNIDKIHHIVASPTMFIVGDSDDVVPSAHSRALHHKCGAHRKKLMALPGNGHNDIIPFGLGNEAVAVSICEFLRGSE